MERALTPPAVSVVLPTLNSAATLTRALGSLARQDYAGEVEIVVVDGGSSDATRAIAADHGARVIENPQRVEEEARALGLEAADGELVLLLDADNELPANDWLTRVVAGLDSAPNVVAADALFHEWRAEDPPVTRLCALMGGTDPLAIDLGYGDRWAFHLGRWTGGGVLEEEDRGEALVVRVDPERPPPMGSNGFLARREALLATGYRPYVHSDVAGDLAEQGFRFARVKLGIVHHYAPTVRAYTRKAQRRARRSVTGQPPQRRGLERDVRAIAGHAARSLLVVPTILTALRGYRRRPDPAWALYPLLYLVTTLSYAWQSLLAVRPARREPV